MPLPENYLPRIGDVLVLHVKVMFNFEPSEGPEVWTDSPGTFVSIDQVVGVHRRSWREGDAVRSRSNADQFGEVLTASEDVVLVKLAERASQKGAVQGHRLFHCNEIEPLPEDKPKPSNFAIALAEALPKEVGSKFALIERQSRADVLVVTPGFIMPSEDRHRLQKIAFATAVHPVRLAFSDIEPDDRGLLPNERPDAPQTWESDQGPRPIPPLDPAASPIEPDAELRQRLRKKMLSRGVIPPADLNLVEVATGADLDKLAAYYNLNRYALSEEEFQGRIAADEVEGAAVRNSEEPL